MVSILDTQKIKPFSRKRLFPLLYFLNLSCGALYQFLHEQFYIFIDIKSAV